MVTNPDEIRLSEQQSLFLARQADLTGRSWQSLLEQFVPTANDGFAEVRAENAREAAERIGFIEACHGGPTDLATNPQHMRGFGE